MKKLISMVITFAVLCSMAGCMASDAGSDKLSVVASIFPCYDWASNVIEGSDNVDLELLIDSGVDFHSFQPTAEDILKIKTCDIFIYVGGESDSWVDEVLTSDCNPDMKIISLMDELSDEIREEETVLGMQAEDGEPDGPEYDEHVWLSLRNAEVITDRICEVMSQADPGNSALYEANTEKYTEELKALDSRYIEELKDLRLDTIVVADRFPFRYLTDDYGLEYYAAFAGCSAEANATFDTVVFLSQKAADIGTNVILTTEDSASSIAGTVIETGDLTGVEIMELDSMQSVTSEDISAGVSYIGIMESNLEVLVKALS